MNKKTLLLKYLDNELSGLEKDQVEELLEKNPKAKQILEEIQSKKQTVLDHLVYLKPSENIIIPEWEEKEISPKPKKKPIFNILKWAAILIIPIGIYFLGQETMKQSNNRTIEQSNNEQEDPSLRSGQAMKQSELDYAISPNRSWTKKLLITSELNTKII